jgi:hypothetical protein
MLFVTIFDFALAGLALSILGFFVWCWAAFREDRKLHPIYTQSAVLLISEPGNRKAEKDCA